MNILLLAPFIALMISLPTPWPDTVFLGTSVHHWCSGVEGDTTRGTVTIQIFYTFKHINFTNIHDELKRAYSPIIKAV